MIGVYYRNFIDWLSGSSKAPLQTPEQRGVTINSPIGQSYSSRSGIRVDEHSALKFSAFFACIRLIASTLASLPINIYVKEGDKRDIAQDHDQYPIVKYSPNEIFTSFKFRELLKVSALLYGNGYAKILRRNGRPIKYYLLHPSRVEPIIVENALYYRITAHNSFGIKIESEIVHCSDIIHISSLGHGLLGKSIVQLAKESIGMALSQVDMASELYDNGLRTDGWIKRKDTLTLAKTKLMRESFQAQLQAWGIPILDEDSEFHEFGMPLKDAEFILNRKFQVEDIARWFGVDPALIGQSDKPSYNNIEQQNIGLVQRTLMPWAVCMEQEFARKILREKELSTHYIKIELNGLLRGDVQVRGDFYQKLADRGVFSINEMRKLEDLNPIPDGDRHLVPMNMIPLDKVDEHFNKIKSSGNGKPANSKEWLTPSPQ